VKKEGFCSGRKSCHGIVKSYLLRSTETKKGLRVKKEGFAAEKSGCGIVQGYLLRGKQGRYSSRSNISKLLVGERTKCSYLIKTRGGQKNQNKVIILDQNKQ
jgi:hypothetical protein